MYQGSSFHSHSGHLPSKKDRKILMRESEEEGSLSHHRQKVKEVVDVVHQVDAGQKALTGRKPEQYAEESGIPLDELFPEDKQIINIGDPWQTLDLPGVTSVDYESGEEAEFVRDTEVFLESVQRQVESVLSQLEHLHDNNSLSPLVSELLPMITGIQNDHAHPEPEEYETIGKRWKAIAQKIATREHDDSYDDYVFKEMWYQVERLGRGFLDLALWEKVILPELTKEAVRTKGLTAEQEAKYIEDLITEHRFVRRMKNADLKKACFPDLPYDDHSFDRLTASWSLSTHMFQAMDHDQFMEYWNEVDRLLKKDGVAYLWPVYNGNEGALIGSLNTYRAQGGDALLLSGDHNHSILTWLGDYGLRAELEEAQTLIVFPRKTSSENKERVFSLMATNHSESDRWVA